MKSRILQKKKKNFLINFSIRFCFTYLSVCLPACLPAGLFVCLCQCCCSKHQTQFIHNDCESNGSVIINCSLGIAQIYVEIDLRFPTLLLYFNVILTVLGDAIAAQNNTRITQIGL